MDAALSPGSKQNNPWIYIPLCLKLFLNQYTGGSRLMQILLEQLWVYLFINATFWAELALMK